MSEPVDPFMERPSPAEVADAKGELKAERQAAIERGMAYGADEADRRLETGSNREERIKRAASYAAWEFDGKPLGQGKRYSKEFGLQEATVVGSLERLPLAERKSK